MPNIVVYTAITHGYDTLKIPPPTWAGKANFIAFLETPQCTPPWQIKPIYQKYSDPCRNSKIHKILAHKYFPDAEYSLWIDGTISLISLLPITDWPKKFLAKHDLAVFMHSARKCIYHEAKLCMARHLDKPEIIDRQMQNYFEQGYPPNNGLAECSVIFRRHTSRIGRFNEKWWQEIKNHSRRDQLSFNYVVHKLGLKYYCLPGNLRFENGINGNTLVQRGRWHTAPRSDPTQNLV